jgi:hypothetical protein
MLTEPVTADITKVDGCPVLQKMRAFIVNQGECRDLQWQILDTNGRPISLLIESPTSAGSESSSSSASSAGSESSASVDTYTVQARFREILPAGSDKVHLSSATVYEAVTGVIRCSIPAAVAARTGIYEINFGVSDSAARLLHVSRAFLSVERSLFAVDSISSKRQGSPTLQEIRLSIRDSTPENLWLDGVEFDAAEVIQCIARPVQYWNEIPPPIGTYNTGNFPFREHWLRAIQAHLFQLATHHYRRVELTINTGGVSVADKDRERPYAEASERLMAEWRSFVMQKKAEINMKKCTGSVNSIYGSM